MSSDVAYNYSFVIGLEANSSQIDLVVSESLYYVVVVIASDVVVAGDVGRLLSKLLKFDYQVDLID